VVAAAAALVGAAGVLAWSLAPPDPTSLAVQDGCGRNDAATVEGLTPNWVRVFDSQTAATAPPPPLRWAHGVASSNGVPWYSPHVSGGDLPLSHSGYDVNMDVKLDPADADLIGTANAATAGAESGEVGRLHTEREAQATPFFVWPESGDHVTLRGYWVWDCDHYLPAGERTELHPITAMWVERRRSPRSPRGEAEGDLFLTTDKTQAGKQADCAHRTKGDQQAFKQCVRAEADYVDMSGTYQFKLRIPAGAGEPTVRVVDEGSVGAPPIRTRRAGNALRVSFFVPADGRRHVVAKEVFAGRSRAPRWQHFRVSVAKVLIRRSMDPGCVPLTQPPCGSPETTRDDQVSHGPNGEWNFYWDVGGGWSLWKPNVFSVRDGQTIHPRVSADLWVPRGGSFRILVWPRECDWGTLRLGTASALYPCPTQPEVGNRGGDDVPGATLATVHGPGSRALLYQWRFSTCPRAANPRGCYAAVVRVRRIG
jgi:hypothetical protein